MNRIFPTPFSTEKKPGMGIRASQERVRCLPENQPVEAPCLAPLENIRFVLGRPCQVLTIFFLLLVRDETKTAEEAFSNSNRIVV